MPLNKLENFIKNYEGRILYVNSNDLDATDSITNQGNSLAKPFKTIQRAVLESARFSFIPGENNDRNDRTTILVFPGDHIVDNRPGWGIRQASPVLAEAVSPSGLIKSPASDAFDLSLQSNFDLTQEDNILYKFNSVTGGVILPRGTSIVGLDLRKTKIRPKYIPNPTDVNVPGSSIFRVTGNCFFWNFSFFDGNPAEVVYTDNRVFDSNSGNQAVPTFSHHKLTCFEYCDGVNIQPGYDLTDLDIYYAKLSNAFNEGSGRAVPSGQKFPLFPGGFAKQRSEWEIVGAFGTDPIQITNIYSGDGATPNAVVTVTTNVAHKLTVDTPIKIRGVNVFDYNISTVVQSVPTPTTFTYLLQAVRNDLPADPGGSATVVIDTDTVRGASPYIFNCSIRSTWGMNGMHADGSKASGFRSMVVAQFTAISLQKDDRAFVKYDSFSKTYLGIPITRSIGTKLSSDSASTNSTTVYHLDPDAVYRRGWETSHIKCSNDSIIQVVSVFAIGFNSHFVAFSGGDQSITNSNSNFGQFSLTASGFKKESFTKDSYGYITSIITPRSITSSEQTTDWMTIDINLTSNVGISSHIYLYGFKASDNPPPSVVSGAKVGARKNESLYLTLPGVDQTVTSGKILMTDNVISSSALWSDGFGSSEKEYKIATYAVAPNYDTIYTSTVHKLQTGEKIVFVSDTGELPDNISQGTIYYAIRGVEYQTTELRVATSLTNAINGVSIKISGGANLKVISRVIDKESGELGSPIQYDPNNSNWFVHLDPQNTIYPNVVSLGTAGFDNEPRTDATFISRIPDSRSLDERLFKVRIVIPKEAPNAKDPSEGFIIQESSKTGALEDSEFTLSSIGLNNFDYKRNYRYISNCTETGGVVTVTTEKAHGLNVGDRIFVKDVKSTSNTSGTANAGYNGDFVVASIVNYKQFTYSTTDINKIQHNVGVFQAPTSKTKSSPRIERNDLQSNLYIYRLETIKPYLFNAQDGVYHAYVLKADRSVPNHFTDYKYSQNVVDLYPQQDRDNINDNPQATFSYAKSSPLGDVVTNDLKKSLTREALDTLITSFGQGLKVSSVSGPASGITNVTFDREHGLSGIVGYASLTSGSGFTNGTYYNVRLLNTDNTWNGATATVVISGGSITSLNISDTGCGYISGQTLKVEGFSPSTITLSSTVITTAVNNTIQFSGIGTASDNLVRIQGVLSPTQIAIAQTSGDSSITQGQYAIQVGPSTVTSSTQYSSVTGITTFTFALNHGLIVGNKFKVINDSFSASNNLGDYIVKEVVGVNTFTALTNTNLGNTVRVLKYAINSNDILSNAANENIGSRGHHFYDNEYAILKENISATDSSGTASFAISIPNAGISTITRFGLGNYIMIDSEIMRISSSTLSGSANNKITAIRGYFGTTKDNHSTGSIIKKIKPLPIEIRRPSILRASGHTFEYLGYGPGNYSTGLPQIQIKSLTEREDFLAQAQERTGGSALYTGMNSNGDFFIGNTKYSAQSGQEKSFDIPVATITGQDASRLSALFDEIIIRERIVVEGGKSKQILSQFDGPVNFSQNVIFNTEQVKINATLVSSGLVKFNNLEQSTVYNNGAIVVRGGVGILKNLNVGGNFTVSGVTTFIGPVTFDSGLIPQSLETAYIGQSDKAWAEAWIGGIGISTEGVPGGTEPQDRTIRGLTGNLIIDSVTGITSVTSNLELGETLLVKKTSRFQGNVQIDTGIIPDSDEDSYIGTATTSFTEAHIAEINIGVGGTAKINTRSGNLVLNSATGKTEIDDDLIINETLSVIKGTQFNGNVVIVQDLIPSTTTASNNAALGNSTKKFREAYIDEIRIGYTSPNTIDTSSGDLLLDSTNDQVTVNAKLTVDQTSIFTGIVTVTNGIVPSITDGCGIGKVDRRFSEAHIDNIRIGVTDPTTIDTRVDSLIIDSANGTVLTNSNFTIQNSKTLVVSGQTYLTGLTTVYTGIVPENNAYLGNSTKRFSEAYIDDVKIGATASNVIDTVGNNLVLDAFTGTVEVSNNLKVNSKLTVDQTSIFTGIVTVTNGIVPSVTDGCGIGKVDRRFSEAYIDNIKIGVTGSTTIDTRINNLVIDSFDGTVLTNSNFTIQNSKTLVVSGQSYHTGLTTVAGGLVPFTNVSSYLGSENKRFSNAWIGDVKISVDSTNKNEITTRDQNLRLNAYTSIVEVTPNLKVNQNLDVSGKTYLSGIASVGTGLIPQQSKIQYLGSPVYPFGEAHIGNIQLAYGVGGSDDNNLVSTSTNDLKLDSATGTVSVINHLDINGNLSCTGLTTFFNSTYFASNISPTTNLGSSLGTPELNWSYAYIGKVYIDGTVVSTITSGSGVGLDLTLTSTSDTVNVKKDLVITRNAYITGIATVHADTVVDGILTVNGGSGSDSVILKNGGDLKIYNSANTGSSNLFVDINNELKTSGSFNAGGSAIIQQNLNVTGISTFNDNVVVKGGTKTFKILNNSNVEKFSVTTDEGNTIIQGTLECKTTTTTRQLVVIGQNNSTTHVVIGSALVKTPSTSTTTGSLVVYGGVGIEGGDLNVSGNASVGAALTVKTTLFVSGSSTFTGEIVANGGLKGTVALANKATNVVGASNCVLFNTGTDLTTTSSNLQFINNELRVGGDIIAFYGSSSDDKLKTNREKLNNALSKVLLLNGFTYNWNQKAISLGFDENQSCVGVSAQEVQKVLPEAVIEKNYNGEDILLVKYEKLVPLLIEAIKELNEKVESLERKLSNK